MSDKEKNKSVYCKSCAKWVKLSQVLVFDVEEESSWQIVTFKCPKCETEQKSSVNEK
jgi:RNase P subunit RPR2